MTIAERIRLTRQKKKMSQVELAEITNINTKSLSRYELGTTIPPANLIAEIADALGVSTDYLIKGQTSIIQDVELYDKFAEIQAINGKAKEMIISFLDMAIRDAKARKAYS